MDDLNKVNIFLLGSRKSGTTSLANYLASHKEISLSRIKESNYWNDEALERTKTIDEYHALFDWSVNNQLDASTGYTTYPICAEDLPEKIYNYNPKAKLIYLVRHPLERIISHYKMSYERGDLSGSLNDALVNHPLLIASGKYNFQLQRYLKFFPLEQLLVLNTKDLTLKITQKRIKEFLGLNFDFESSIPRDNTSTSDFRMPRDKDALLNSKVFVSIKRLFPQSMIRFVKRQVFNSINAEMDTSLNAESLALLKRELYDDMKDLASYSDIDIEQWINFEEYIR